jgi:DNA polymerase-3 subunit epsilon
MTLSYIGNRVIVGHHINFDVMMINKMLDDLHLPRLKNQTIDTAQLIKRIENPLNAYNLVNSKELSLDELSQKFDIITKQRHTAAGDAYITALVFIKLLELLKKREVRTLKDLLRR